MTIPKQIKEHVLKHDLNPDPQCCYCIGLVSLDEKEIERKIRDGEKKYLRDHMNSIITIAD